MGEIIHTITPLAAKLKQFCSGFKVLIIWTAQPFLVFSTGLSDIPGESMVKLYCPKCQDVYSPKSSRHHHTDGAYFGTGFPHMLFMVHPEYRPKRPANQFVPRSVMWRNSRVAGGHGILEENSLNWCSMPGKVLEFYHFCIVLEFGNGCPAPKKSWNLIILAQNHEKCHGILVQNLNVAWYYK